MTNEVPAKVCEDIAYEIIAEINPDLDFSVSKIKEIIAAFLVDNHLKIVER